jgi:hypothetical protein
MSERHAYLGLEEGVALVFDHEVGCVVQREDWSLLEEELNEYQSEHS